MAFIGEKRDLSESNNSEKWQGHIKKKTFRKYDLGWCPKNY